MGSPSPSPAAKASLFGAVAAVHVGLLAMLAAPADRVGLPATGGAPVINLTLMPSPRMDGREAERRTADRSRAGSGYPPPSAPAPTLAPTPPGLGTAGPPRAPPTGDVAPFTTAQARSASPGPAPGSPAPPGGGEPRVGEAAIDSRAGQTPGGGAPSLGAAAAPSEDRYAAQVIAWVERRKRDPGGRVSGVAVLRFVLDRQGRLREATIVSAQGDRQVGPIALDTLRAAQPFPRPPTDAIWRTREFHVRLDYRPDGR